MSKTFLESLANMRALEEALNLSAVETRAALLKHWGIEVGVTIVVGQGGEEWLVKGLASQYFDTRDASEQPWLKGVKRTKTGWSQAQPQTIYEWKAVKA